MSQPEVLYVEDDANDVLFMRFAWKKAGLLNKIQVVTDGEQAMHYLSGEGQYANRAEHPMPRLVLLDLKLPKVSGLEVLKWIREQPAIHTLQVVVLSSSNRPMDVHTAHALRANAYLVKPSDTEGLAQIAASLNDFWLSRVQPPPECLQFRQ
ncbi:MAG: response regulator [Verrucomicrobiota bacterium]